MRDQSTGTLSFKITILVRWYIIPSFYPLKMKIKIIICNQPINHTPQEIDLPLINHILRGLKVITGINNRCTGSLIHKMTTPVMV